VKQGLDALIFPMTNTQHIVMALQPVRIQKSMMGSAKTSKIQVEYKPFIPGTGRRLVADHRGVGGREVAGGHEGVNEYEAGFHTKRYCDSHGKDLLFAGTAMSKAECLNKCTLVPTCAVVSFSDYNDCVLKSSCDQAKVDTKGTGLTSFRKEAKSSGSISMFLVLGLILLLGCLLVLIILHGCRQKPGYTILSNEEPPRPPEFRPVEFRHVDFQLKQEGLEAVKQAAKQLRQRPPDNTCIIGYTGKPGGRYNTVELCQKLAFERATRVMHPFQKEGCRNRIVPIGHGNVLAKGGICEIIACTDEDANAVSLEARNKGHFV